jgi:glycerophosphoryl diester phosphodiesterase
MPVLSLANVAHRGASFVAPENTLSSYRAAVEAGANGAECDVYKTADNVLVLSHDKSTARTTIGGNLDITKSNFEDLQKLDAGSKKNKKFAGEKIPTLDQYLKLLKNTDCHPVIEIKMEQIEQLVLDAVRDNGLLDKSVIISFSEKTVKELRRLDGGVCAAWLYGENLAGKGNAEKNADRLAEFLTKKSKELDTNILDLQHNILSKNLIDKLKKSNIHVWCWTVNDAKRMKELLDWGVESITTDRPELLSEVLKEHKKEK